VNHLSDSVSVVDVGSTPPRVVRTLLVGDEPRDIVFAGPTEGDANGPFTRAFVTTAHRGQNSPFPRGEYDLEGVGRADVWVFDATNLGSSPGGDPLEIVTLFGDTPRALAATPDGSSVYAAVFHSGNQTTAVSEVIVCDGGSSEPSCPLDGITVPGGLPGGKVPGGLPAPNQNSDFVNGPEVGLIVKLDPGTGQWEDELGRNWNNAVRFDLPDLDVFEIDADANPPAETDAWASVGTILFNMAVNPVNGKLYVSNTEAINEVRFEGPGSFATGKKPPGEPTTVLGHLHEARITLLDPNHVEARHLNKHITDYSTLPPEAKGKSLATPLGMAVSSDGATLYVAAFGSSKIGVFSTTELENDTFEPDPNRHISVSGGGPTGVVLDEANQRLYVLTRFDNSVSVVDLTSGSVGTEVDHVAMYNPEPPKVVNGRPFLYDATFTSSNGEASCSGCHVFADFDSLGWDLGNPDDIVVANPNPFPVLGVPNPVFHPMKGPMTTQSLRGLANQGPMHWRGDRTGGNAVPPGDPLDEELAFKAFNVAFEGLLGRDEGPIPEADMQAFTDYILEVTYPPNPIRQLDNSLRPDESAGRSKYFLPGSDGPFSCNQCHTLSPIDGFFGTDGGSSFEDETQEFKVAHLRSAYQKIGMFGMPGVPAFIRSGDNAHKGPQIRGFGFLHDGSIDTVFRFLRALVFTGVNDAQAANLEAFIMAFDSTLAPIVGQQITLREPNDLDAGARIGLMIQRAMTPFDLVDHPGATECDLIVKGTVGGESRGWLMTGPDSFQSDKAAEDPLTDDDLRALTSTQGQELTYTCAPPGSGVRMGIDRDEDDVLDGDEAGGAQSEDQQKCINELNKNFAKVAKAQGKDIGACLKDGSKGKLETQSIEECITADNDGKVVKAQQKTLAKAPPKCTLAPEFGATDPNTVNRVAVEKGLALIHAIFGSDLDAAIFDAGVEKDAAKCQVAVAKAVQKCQDTKLKEFNRCKKSGLKDGSIFNAIGLGACMGFDEKDKIAKACDTKLGDKISKSCAGNLDVFPGCGDPPTAGDLRDCLDRLVRCEVCRGLNAVDDLVRDCDTFDDDMANASCP
jgi:DNA-binding beta-propeller fold protein YncE